MKIHNWPISKYIGSFPKGKWEFVKDVRGTYEEALEEALRLQVIDPKTGKKHNHYKIWDEL